MIKFSYKEHKIEVDDGGDYERLGDQKFGVIYCATCKINNKMYVGQTIKTMKERNSSALVTVRMLPKR